MYLESAAYGHMGRNSETIEKEFKLPDGTKKTLKVELFTWEKLDVVDSVRKKFNVESVAEVSNS